MLNALDEIFDDAINTMLEAGDEVPTPAGTLEAFAVPESTGIVVELPTLKGGGTVLPLKPVTFSTEAEVQPWEDAEIASEERLVPAGS